MDNKSDFQGLKWDDLISWAGPQILSRGKSYKESVSELRRLSDKEILASVSGASLYTTAVSRGSSGKLSANCTCPFPGTPCKHAVATVLVFLDMLKNRQPVLMVSKSDKRLKFIEKFSTGETVATLEVQDEDFSNDPNHLESPVVVNRASVHPAKKLDQWQLIRHKLESMSADGIIELIVDLVKMYPEIGRKIEEALEIRTGRVTKIVESIRGEVEILASEHSWSNHWSGKGNLPDYSNVRKKLQLLLDAGHADEVLELGEDLWSLGNEQLETSDDEGELSDQIAECMEVVLEAVRKSSLPVRDQILWMINTSQEDNFYILYHLEESLNKIKDVNAWSEVADHFIGRLENRKISKKKEESIESKERTDIVDWAVKSLEKSERQKDIIPLLEREAPVTHCYDVLVDQLLIAGRRDEAKTVAVKGFKETFEHKSWIASKLQAALRAIAEQDGDIPLAAAYYSLEFFHGPSRGSYIKLRNALESSPSWPDVRKAAVKFLETGIRPDLDSSRGLGNRAKTCTDHWPLPCPEIVSIAGKPKYGRFPDNMTLLEIAIYEKDLDAIVHRYNLLKNFLYNEVHIHDEVAGAVQQSNPDLSLEIYGDLARKQIAKVKPAAYANAAIYLRKMKTIYEINDRMSEWTTLIQSIRTAHKAKRSLMEILNMMEAESLA